MNKHLEWLGYKVKDVVTGMEGVVDSVSFDLYGCVQASINPGLDKEGKFKIGSWFDVKRLKRLSSKPIMSVPNFDIPEIGAASKPAFNR